MDNQNLNNNEVPIQGSQNINVVDTVNNTVTQMGNTPVKEEEVVNQAQPAPSLMRESIDRNGNVVNSVNNQGPDIADKTIDAVEGFMDTVDHKKEFSEDEVKRYKTKAMVSYIPLISLIFILTNKTKQSSYLKFHANQGLVITIMWVIVCFIEGILSALFSSDSMLRNSTPGWVSFISYLLYCICFLATLYGIINTYNDSSKELPLVGKIKLLK